MIEFHFAGFNAEVHRVAACVGKKYHHPPPHGTVKSYFHFPVGKGQDFQSVGKVCNAVLILPPGTKGLIHAVSIVHAAAGTHYNRFCHTGIIYRKWGSVKKRRGRGGANQFGDFLCKNGYICAKIGLITGGRLICIIAAGVRCPGLLV